MMDDEESGSDLKIKKMPEKRDIYINNLSYQYEGPRSPFALKDIDLVIEENKLTAIVGMSGSGKTTLLKMILGFYQPVTGDAGRLSFRRHHCSKYSTRFGNY
jgi:ATP-binding cassette subfamily B protein